MTFELKGGTSLSMGFQIIDRFSEDIDIRIEPPGAHEGRLPIDLVTRRATLSGPPSAHAR
jgi:predicted nucleotidyltransferase component of viral defense system